MSLHVLLVEDDRQLRQTLQAALETHGYTVTGSASKADAQAVLRHHQQTIDLVIVKSQFAYQQPQCHVIHVGADFESDGFAKSATRQSGFQRLNQIFTFVLVDFHVFVTGETERVVVENLHAGEEVVEVRRDHVLERDEGEAVTDRQEPPQQLLRQLPLQAHER